MRKVLQGIFYLILGGVFIWSGVKTYLRYQDLSQRLSQTTGQVTALFKVKDREQSVYPKVKFQDASGKSRFYTSNLTFKARSITVGDTLLLFYNPKKTQEVFIYSGFNRSWLPWILISVGGAFLVAGGLIGYKAARKRTAKST